MFNPVIAEDSQIIADRLGGHLSDLSGKTILVTGTSGFLCSYLVDIFVGMNERALEKPLRIIAVDNNVRGTKDRLAHLAEDKNVRMIEHDVTQPMDLRDSVDYIIHGASIASPTFYRKFPLETIDVNVNGLRRLLDLGREGAQSIVYLSSSEVYGDPAPNFIPTPETYHGDVSCTGPRACYDESKRLGETLCVTYASQFDLPVKMVRPFNVYGPGQRLDDKRIVPDLLSAVRNKQPITLFSDGRATRSFCYAADFIFGMLLVLLKGQNGEPYNVGNDTEISIKDAADIAAKLASPALSIDFQASTDFDYLTDNPQRRCPDLSKVKKLSFSPSISAKEGFKRTLRSYES